MNSAKQVVEKYKKDTNSIKESDKHFANQQQADRYNDKVSDFLANLTPNQKKIALQEIKYRKAKEDFGEYLTLCNQDYKLTKFHRFLIKVCQSAVERVERNRKGDLSQASRTIICVSVPPQLGKSETITKSLPSWFVGRNPNLSAILVAYNGDIGEQFCSCNRDKTREFGKKVFGVEISETDDTKEKYHIKGKKGFVMGRGINGGITSWGCELLIIDDPYKSSNEAFSPTYREMVSRVFKDSCWSRLHAGGVCIIIHTRWHEEDLIGEYAKDENAIVINIPLVCDSKNDPLKREIGETLCPELGFGVKFAEETKKQAGLKTFNSLYQGKPHIEGGDIFKREWLKFYDEKTLPSNFDEQTISCDLSFGGKKKQNDPCAIQVWGRVGANHYLLKHIKKRLTFTEMCEMIKIVSATYPLARRKIIEKKANGQAVIDTLNSEIGGFMAYDPKMTDKVGRANAISPYIQSGNVWFPKESVDETIEEMIEEMMTFPNSDHDDEVDAMTQYLNVWATNTNGKFNTSNTIISFSKVIRGLYDD